MEEEKKQKLSEQISKMTDNECNDFLGEAVDKILSLQFEIYEVMTMLKEVQVEVMKREAATKRFLGQDKEEEEKDDNSIILA